MRIVPPKPFTFQGGRKAVLLLHGFTGNPADVKQLGKYLHERNYTCHAPLYKGHGMEPATLLQSGPEDWWRDVVDGYHFLQAEGYKEIAVAGVSLGGVFSLKLGAEMPVKGIVSMCAPMLEKSIDDLYQRVRNYARMYKRFEGKDTEQIEDELNALEEAPMQSLHGLRDVIREVRGQLQCVTAPAFVVQGCLDDPLYQESAQLIYDHVNTGCKQIKWYEESGHIITLDKERAKVFEDVCAFLDSLDW